jgi:hypothetical protein
MIMGKIPFGKVYYYVEILERVKPPAKYVVLFPTVYQVSPRLHLLVGVEKGL